MMKKENIDSRVNGDSVLDPVLFIISINDLEKE